MRQLLCSVIASMLVMGASGSLQAQVETPPPPQSEESSEGAPLEEESSEGAPLEEESSEEAPLEEESSEGAPLEEESSEGAPLEEVSSEEVSPEEEILGEESADSVDDTVTQEIVTGPGVGLDISTGLIGIYAPVNIGLVFPKLSERLHLGIRATWAMPAISLAHENAEGTEVITYLPWIATGGIFLNAGSGVIRQLLRVYFGAEIYAGVTVATTSGLIGKNVTLGINVFGGLEFYVSQRFVIFLEGGVSGLFTFVYGDEGELGTMTQHGGSGFFLRFGPRFYFGRRD